MFFHVLVSAFWLLDPKDRMYMHVVWCLGLKD